jgi:hypothetical protein
MQNNEQRLVQKYFGFKFLNPCIEFSFAMDGQFFITGRNRQVKTAA